MKTTQLTIAYDAEKLIALRQYANKKQVSVEAELAGTLDRLYEKLIHPAVREYIEQRDAAPGLPSRTPEKKPRPTPVPLSDPQ